MAHKLSKEIVFDKIKEKTFNELLTSIKSRNVKTTSGGEYRDEGRDGFLDLYNYWNERGSKRIKIKIASNNEYLK